MTPESNSTETLAGVLYDHYTESVGGVNFKGEPLPSWNEFRADDTKKLQSDAWVEVARKAECEMSKDKNLIRLIALWAKERFINAKGWLKCLYGIIIGICFILAILLMSACSNHYGINYDKETGNIGFIITPVKVTPTK